MAIAFPIPALAPTQCNNRCLKANVEDVGEKFTHFSCTYGRACCPIPVTSNFSIIVQVLFRHPKVVRNGRQCGRNAQCAISNGWYLPVTITTFPAISSAIPIHMYVYDRMKTIPTPCYIYIYAQSVLQQPLTMYTLRLNSYTGNRQ